MKNFKKLFAMAGCIFMFGSSAFAMDGEMDHFIRVEGFPEQGQTSFMSLNKWVFHVNMKPHSEGSSYYSKGTVADAIEKFYAPFDAERAKYLAQSIRFDIRINLVSVPELPQILTEVSAQAANIGLPAMMESVLPFDTIAKQIAGTKELQQKTDALKQKLQALEEKAQEAQELFERTRRATSDLMDINDTRETLGVLHAELDSARDELRVLALKKEKLMEEFDEFRRSEDYDLLMQQRNEGSKWSKPCCTAPCTTYSGAEKEKAEHEAIMQKEVELKKQQTEKKEDED